MILLTNSAPPHLHISRPTSTTVAFTVTTRPVADTVPKKALLYFSHTVRLGLGVLILALFWARWRSFFPLAEEGEGDDGDPGWERALLTNRVGVVVAWAAEQMDWKALAGGGAVGLWAVVRRGYTGRFTHTHTHSGSGVEGKVGALTGFCRGVAAGAEGLGCPDFELVADVPLDCDDALHPDGVDTGYLHS